MSSASIQDHQALQGNWEQTALEDSGVLDSADGHSAPGAITTIKGSQFQVVTVSGETLLAGSFSIDASTTPKSITWIDAIGDDAGKELPASYTLEGDNFVFIAGDEGAPRPTRFSTGPGQTMRTFCPSRQLNRTSELVTRFSHGLHLSSVRIKATYSSESLGPPS